MLKLITAIFVTKKLNGQSVNNHQSLTVDGYGSNIKLRKHELPKFAIKLPDFTERLSLSDSKTKGYYNSLMEYCDTLNIKHTIYKHKVKFFDKDRIIANLYFTHKTLRLCIALTPDSFDNERVKYRDFSAYKKHAQTPMAILLNTNKSVVNAKMLIFTKLSNNIA